MEEKENKEVVEAEVVQETKTKETKTESSTNQEEVKASGPNQIEQTPNKLALILIIIFLGWLGIDKLYYSRGTKLGVFYFLMKIVFMLIGVSFIWNILDLIFAILDQYKLNPVDYFSKETAQKMDDYISSRI